LFFFAGKRDMVESLKELNKICQKPRYREVGNWMVRYVLRDLALPITWCLLHTPVTANQVTFAALLIGLAGNFFLTLKEPGAFFWGMMLLQLWYLLDHVDGQIARYRKTVSLTGRFFDFMMHHMIHATFFFAVGVSIFLSTGIAGFLVLGFLTSLFAVSFNLLSDLKCKTIYEKLISLKSVRIDYETSKAAESGPEAAPSKTRRFFSVLHKATEFHVVMNVFTLAAFAEAFVAPFHARFYLFAAYTLTLPFITIAKTAYWIKTQKIDADFHQIFRETGS
jgi:hypothetical protein